MLRSKSPAAIGMFATFLVAVIVVAQPADTRPALPKKTETAASEKLVHEIFKADFAKTKPADRTALALKLLEQAEASKDDNAARYVLIHEALNTSAKAGDTETYLKAADALSKSFKISLADAQTTGVDSLTYPTATAAREGGQALLDATDAAIGAGEFDAAQKLLKATETAGRRGGSAPLSASIALRTKSFASLRKEYEKLPEARKKLESTPTDAEANLLVGRFLCFVKNDWENGLPHLVLGSDKTLQAAAEKDSKAGTGTTADKSEAGDTWYKLGSDSDPLTKASLMARALARYKDAQADATGLTKIRIEKRIEELSKSTKTSTGSASPATSAVVIWSTIKQAIKDKSFKEGKTVGTEYTTYPRFADLPATGGVLIGFRCSGQANYIDYLQPIYRNAQGEFVGRAFGSPGVAVTAVKAKEGYAISTLIVHSNGRYLHGLETTFTKLGKTGFDASDTYKGNIVGGEFGASETFGDVNTLLIGIHGRIYPNTLGVATIGVLTVPINGESDAKTKKK